MDPAERADSPTSAAAPTPLLASEILAWHEVTRPYRRPLGGWWWAGVILVPLVLAVLSSMGSQPGVGFLIDFATYLVAFGLGAGLVWLVLRQLWPARTADEAFAAVDSAREPGARR